jgi:UDP-N-acetylglucosamine enolpyruvyl transferase
LCLDERLSRLCAPVMATDLRASVSLVIAALAAEGELGRRT